LFFVRLPHLSLLHPNKPEISAQLPKYVHLELWSWCCSAHDIHKALDCRLECSSERLAYKLDNLELVLTEGLFANELGFQVEKPDSFVDVVNQVYEQILLRGK